MPTLDRLGDRLRSAGARGERLLVLYLTLGDPLADPLGLAVAAVKAGADVIEVGLPTPRTSPAGADIASSFDRARGCAPDRVWDLVRELRARLPVTPLLSLVYPQTVADIGADWLLGLSAGAGVDGLVLTDPDGALPPARVASTGLSAIPLVRADADADRRRRLEEHAGHLTYQALAARTGARLDPGLAEEAARTAGRPFLAGFGVRDELDIRAVAPHAAGVVIGSALYRGLASTAPAARMEWAAAAVRRWKAATVVAPIEPSGSEHAR
ncbi:tryptophan synthase subunit alpha [Nonomuraea longicatena]|uniref:tryptophan synthase n=1 Tax=Nonomuraea longicatena TaxID=83682 RepID=A0ABN1QW42_9ACTN